MRYSPEVLRSQNSDRRLRAVLSIALAPSAGSLWVSVGGGSARPVAAAGIGVVATDVSVGLGDAVLLMSDGTVEGVGENYFGQLGTTTLNRGGTAVWSGGCRPRSCTGT